MRLRTCVIAALGVCLVGVGLTGPAAAQAYDPNYPVCLRVYGGTLTSDYIDCRFTSLPECRATASGRPATCSVNPFYAGPKQPPKRRAHRYRDE
ncbi:hypothetical protein CI1B_63110 [Bradyrhizobium ivorense]|uniref:DUF3551 domain-containing protein n=1 Tax=Bradyrhizobium ivorense TaxID=2511166 RepID=A0A508TPQ2_9BRAD|nr:DUF3551 domain-containing protein [Bradyrhizobium ivorense]VIO76244.1 hypothetical protein CI1B_63110 [Bradyrhizobium ivorense]